MIDFVFSSKFFLFYFEIFKNIRHLYTSTEGHLYSGELSGHSLLSDGLVSLIQRCSPSFNGPRPCFFPPVAGLQGSGWPPLTSALHGSCDSYRLQGWLHLLTAHQLSSDSQTDRPVIKSLIWIRLQSIFPPSPVSPFGTSWQPLFQFISPEIAPSGWRQEHISAAPPQSALLFDWALWFCKQVRANTMMYPSKPEMRRRQPGRSEVSKANSCLAWWAFWSPSLNPGPPMWAYIKT